MRPVLIQEDTEVSTSGSRVEGSHDGKPEMGLCDKRLGYFEANKGRLPTSSCNEPVRRTRICSVVVILTSVTNTKRAATK